MKTSAEQHWHMEPQIKILQKQVTDICTPHHHACFIITPGLDIRQETHAQLVLMY